MFDNARAVNIKHQRFWLLPEKAIYWQKRKTLLVADLHIGKSGHFRKHGIAVPKPVNRSNLDTLTGILKKTSAEHLIILGDLFHSDINNEWKQFITWRKQYRELEVSLVIGNHDILKKKDYRAGIINLFTKMRLDPFFLVHDIDKLEDVEESGGYTLSGHIHPAVKLKGKGRQALKLPCFYFKKDYGILPAFGEFTGTHIIKPKEKDRIYVIANSQVISSQRIGS